METNLKIGDRVRLKSGGPVMSIENTTRYGFLCKWFVGKESKSDIFSPNILEMYSGPNPMPERYQTKSGSSFMMRVLQLF